LLRRKVSSTDTSPDDELDERIVGARPNLENSTACQKSMPSNTSSHRFEASHQAGPATVYENILWLTTNNSESWLFVLSQ